jgi:subtilisin family serine protease
MKEMHIVLRAISGSTREVFLGPKPPSFGVLGMQDDQPAKVSVQVEEIDRRNLPAVAQNRDVLAIAPAMPMKLIEARDIGLAQPAAGSTAWGIQAVKADASPFSGSGIVVAVLDTGIDPTHAAFAGVQFIRKNFTTDGDDDQHGHGTHCAGTIFGRDVSGTRIGVARGVSKAIIGKVLGQGGGSSDQIVSAIQWAVENGANVISMSLGIDFPGYVASLQARGLPPALATSRGLEGYRLNVQLFERMAALVKALGAFTQPTLIVAAAGNESQTDVNPDFEIAVSPPAVADGIMSVAALGQAGAGLAIASFSNRGANVSGPGVAIISAKNGGGLQTMSGTSMATPHVAGVVALWAEKLKGMGSLTIGNLTARTVASGDTSKLNQPFNPFDVGSGLIQAPLN